MRVKRMVMSIATCTVVSDACVGVEDVSRAERWLEQTLHDDLELNIMTFSAIVDACAKRGQSSSCRVLA